KIRTYSGSQLIGTFISQFFFTESVTDTVYTQQPYSSRPSRDTRNTRDGIYNGAGSSISRLLMTLTQTADGYTGTLNVGVNLTGQPVVNTTALILPQVTYGGGWETSLLLSNTNEAASLAQVNFLSANGQALPVPLSSSNVALPGRSTTALVLPNS